MLRLKSNHSTLYFQIRDLARFMRKNPTAAEKFFWQKTRNRSLSGLKINRQFVISFPIINNTVKFFIADFYCHELKLIIEIDGEIHNYQTEADIVRTEVMESFGYYVLRFTNQEVLDKWPFVESALQTKINDLKTVNLF